jgi:hypothetical protein
LEKKKMFKFIKDSFGAVSTILFGEMHQFDPSHCKYDELVAAIEAGDAENFKALIDVGGAIENWAEGDFVFKDGHLFYQKNQIALEIENRIIEMIREGFNHRPMLRFLERLYANPSCRSIKELYAFLKHGNIPITEDGCFLAYKSVSVYDGADILDKNGLKVTKGDLIDSWTGKSHRNNVGDRPNMPRNQVDDNFNNCCGAGLHVGTKQFAYKDRSSIVLKVDPQHVVSVPYDGAIKIRCSEYTVHSLYVRELNDTVHPYSTPPASDYVDDYDEDEDDEEEEGYDCGICQDEGCSCCELPMEEEDW